MDGDGDAVDLGFVVTLRKAVRERCEGENYGCDGHASEIGGEEEVEC